MRRTRIALISALLVVFALTGGGMAQADHAWNDYRWATRDRVVDLYANLSYLRGAWTWVAPPVLSDWDRSERVALGTTPEGKQGVVTVESGDYGASGWLGVAMVRLDSRHRIVAGRVRLNEWYWATGRVRGLRARQHVLCQEFGHVLGLDHVLTASCMNNDPTSVGSWVSPNAHDYDQLEQIYSQPDGYDSGTLAGSSGAASPARAAFNRPTYPWVSMAPLAHNWTVVHVYPAPGEGAHH